MSAARRWKSPTVKTHATLLRAGVWLAAISVCAAMLFFCWQQSDRATWQYDSEGLVIGRIYQMQTGEASTNPAGFLGGFETNVSENKGAACAYDQLSLYFDDVPVAAQEYWAYKHQSGLQGTAWGAVNRVLCLLRLPAQTRLAVLHFASVWLLCAAILVVCVWAKQEWGLLPAVFCGAGLLLSPWTLRACANLYWLLWLYIALFALSAYTCRACERTGRVPLAGMIGLFVALVARFLCGFEFVSAILVCIEVPFVYYFVKHAGAGKAVRKQWLRAAVSAGLVGVVAFASAMLVWFWQLSVQLGSAAQAVATMLVPIANRTGALGAAQASYGQSLAVPMSEVLRLYFMQDTVLPELSVVSLLGIYAVVLTVVALCKKRKSILAQSGHSALFVAVCTALLATLSWLVLARGHAAVHPHINYILWLLPFVPMCCIHLGVCAQELIGYVRASFNKKRGTTA